MQLHDRKQHDGRKTDGDSREPPLLTASQRIIFSRTGKLLCAGLLCSIALIASAWAQSPDRSLIAPDRSAQQAPLDVGVSRAQPVTVDLSLLGAIRERLVADPATPQHLAMPILGNTTLTLVISRVETAGDAHAFHGTIAGIPVSSVVLVERQGIVGGNISAVDATFQIRYRGAGYGHELRDFDQTSFRDHDHSHAPRVPEVPDATPSDALKATHADDGSIIDVMVAYTPAARAAAGGTAAMRTLIALGVTEANAAYANAQVIQRIRLVHSMEVGYVESGNLGTDLARVRGTTDGYMDDVHAARNLYAADLVSLWIEVSSGACGMAAVMVTPSASFASAGFSVVNRTCATGYYSFGHELGHNMGLTHDVYVEPANAAYPYGHGYADPPHRFRTVMAYNDACVAQGVNCTRIPYHSNPAVNYNGSTTGNAVNANEKLALDNTRVTVANFRQSVATTAPAICTLDLDGNGSIDALTDGLMIVRALFNVTGDQVTNGAIGSGYTRNTWAQIGPLFVPAVLDVDGNGRSDALTDGMIILRSIFGMTGTQVTTNALATNPPATRTTWSAIRTYLNTTCGTSFLP